MSYGKFLSAQELLKSYESLEKEFTKKCQLLSEAYKKLKEYENAASEAENKHCAQENTGESLKSGISEVSPPDGGQYEGRNPETSCADGVIFRAFNSDGEESISEFVFRYKKIADKIFEYYLKRQLAATMPYLLGKGGYMPAAPDTKPKSIEEASRLSKHYFK